MSSCYMIDSVQIPEIQNALETIKDYEKEIEIANKRIEFYKNQIEKQKQRIVMLEIKKQQDDFEYNNLINGKINGISIQEIRIYGCPCLETKNVKCDGKHAIHIFDTDANSRERKRINFNNERLFSIEELQSLMYIEKIQQSVNEDFADELRNNCQFAKLYSNKIIRVWNGC